MRTNYFVIVDDKSGEQLSAMLHNTREGAQDTLDFFAMDHKSGVICPHCHEPYHKPQPNPYKSARVIEIVVTPA